MRELDCEVVRQIVFRICFYNLSILKQSDAKYDPARELEYLDLFTKFSKGLAPGSSGSLVEVMKGRLHNRQDIQIPSYKNALQYKNISGHATIAYRRQPKLEHHCPHLAVGLEY